MTASLRTGLVHGALIAAIWLGASVVYSCVFASPQPLWLAIDVAIVAGCIAVVRAHAERLGFGALGAHKPAKLAAIVGLALACVLIAQLVVADGNAVWTDESHYLATLRSGHIARAGLLPYDMRWLAPFAAGPLNVLPVDDADALKAVNFGGLVVACALLPLLLVRLRVPLALAATAPVFALASYLGVYAATNRLVLDPVNYALFVVLAHALLRREHRAYFAVALVALAMNSEKAAYWIPAFAVAACAQSGPRAAAVATARACGPAVAYLVAIRIYMAGAATDSHAFLQNLHVMGLTALGAKISDPAVRPNTFQTIWFPFGAFTVFALLGLERRLVGLALVLVPIVVSVLLASDTDRMVAYAFVVYLPLGFAYLARAVRELPRGLGAALVGLLAAIAVADHYVLPELARQNLARQILAASELAVAGTLLVLHLGWFARRA